MSVTKTVTSHQSLRSLFELNINVNHISENLRVCNAEDDVSKAKEIMDINEYDCIGIEENGKVIGYIDRKEIGPKGNCKEFLKPFSTSEIVSETTSLIQTIYFFKEADRIFILEGNRVNKLVTPADLQKAPVQLLLFGLVSLVEMYLLQLIKLEFPINAWQQYLKHERLESAKRLFVKRQNLNEEMELVDCLQLCDKREIVTRNGILCNSLFKSKNKGERFLKNLEKLRNNLAHAQEFMKHFTANEIISLVEQTEILLARCEEVMEKDKENKVIK